MYKCCFFGHSKIRVNIKSRLKETIKKLISEKNIKEFYTGNNGAFDQFVIEVLSEIYKEDQTIQYTIVLAYLNEKKDAVYTNTVYPEGLETVPKRFAISKRNLWMLDMCEYVIAYIDHPYGNAEKFVNSALYKGKTVINIANNSHKIK